MKSNNSIEFTDSSAYKLIYVIESEDSDKKGLLKIGDASLYSDLPTDHLPPNCDALNQAAIKRIKEYTNTIGSRYKLLHTELAVREEKDSEGNRIVKAFRDKVVHKLLERSGFECHKFTYSTGTEWFKIDIETVKKAIKAVKANHSSLNNTEIAQKTQIVLRPEQEECLNKAVEFFRENKSGNFLINAKMRFGKTVVALRIVSKCRCKKTIIVTHRPVVAKEWYGEFKDSFADCDDIVFASRSYGESFNKALNSDKKVICFASVQDLRGSSQVHGQYEKNDLLFDTVWDCVIIDEAHEGTTTALGKETLSAIIKEDQKKTKVLSLSGTPFNILERYDEESSYTWDYVMEQSKKAEWYGQHFGDSNPYDELPQMHIYTYDLSNVLRTDKYATLEDKAFNFKEFFRTWTTDFNIDHAQMPADASEGDFVHKADVRRFLNLLTRKDDNSNYPFSNDKYRDLFRHTLWMVPGVKEAKALENLLKEHPVFGQGGAFRIINVAGNDGEESKDALNSVLRAIKEVGNEGYTITLSCGKLTTGVTVRDWTAVFMLSGTYSTSAANYLQTIFRVQSPCNINGKVKENAYVFDFAPDRTLKMVAEAVSVSAKTKQNNDAERHILGKFLNYCPVISIDGSGMKEYNASKLLQQLKRAFADRVVMKGFADKNLYNDKMLDLKDVDLAEFEELYKIISKNNGRQDESDIHINRNGLTREERQFERETRHKRESSLSEEEKAKRKAIKEKLQKLKDAYATLRAISIRMPLLIYGADVESSEDITLKGFLSLVDAKSWNEFMPKGVSKGTFTKLQKYYDEDVFIAAGHRIRNLAKEADELEPTERTKRIGKLFSYFKNPDKETVLTPWRVVNMHMGDCIGGYDFFDERHENLLSEPRYVEVDNVTTNIFDKDDCQVLEINSKTGLYPLYITYTIYRKKLASYGKATESQKKTLWNDTLRNNVFVICNTPMAEKITKRTLVGYSDVEVKVNYYKELINTIKNKPQVFEDKIIKGSYWQRVQREMKFDAIVGNPPYSMSDGGSKASQVPLYHHFVTEARKLNPQYVSMIIPAKWFTGGRGLDRFRADMLGDKKFKKMFDFLDSQYCFDGVDIAGGVCYFLWDRSYEGKCEVTTFNNGDSITTDRNLGKYPVFIRLKNALSIIKKIQNQENKFYDEIVSSQKPFGLRTYVKPKRKGDLTLRYSGGTGKFPREEVTSGTEWIDKYKIIISYLTVDHAGRANKSGKRKIFSSLEVLPPKCVCTETYLVVDTFDTQNEAENFMTYLKTKFVRFLVAQVTATQHLSKSSFMMVPVLDFTKKWTDKDLAKKYQLSQEELDLIDSTISPME